MTTATTQYTPDEIAAIVAENAALKAENAAIKAKVKWITDGANRVMPKIIEGNTVSTSLYLSLKSLHINIRHMLTSE